MVDCSLVDIIYVFAPFTLERTSVFSLSRRGHSSTVSPLDLLYTRTRYTKGYIILKHDVSTDREGDESLYLH